MAKGSFFQDEDFLHTFEYYDSVHGVSLNGRTRIITLELSKLEKIVEKPEDKMSFQEHWAVYFKYLTDKTKRKKINKIIELNEGVAMASEVLITITEDEKERFRQLSKEKYELDRQSDLAYAKFEGREEGQNYVLELMAQGLSYEEIRKKIKENKI